MGSSVDFCYTFDLWNTFCEKMGIRTTPSGIVDFLGIFFRAFLRRFLHCQLPQLVLVKVKTAGY